MSGNDQRFVFIVEWFDTAASLIRLSLLILILSNDN